MFVKCIAVVSTLCAVLCGASMPAIAAEGSSVKGDGVMVKITGMDVEPERFRFAPKYSFVQRTGKADRQTTWLLLTDKDPGSLKWRGARPDVDALQRWCGESAAAFLLVELDSDGSPELKTECAGDRSLSVAMISVINGLATVAVSIESDDGARLKGSMVVGSGYCDGEYCDKQGQYIFDAPVGR